MKKNNYKKWNIITMVLLSFLLVGCSGNADEDSNSSKSIAGELDYTITGIEAGAGIMQLTEQAMEEYGLEEYNLQTGSGAAMTQALGDAIENEEPIVVTGWSPHWKFQKFDLKYLDDPKNIYGEGEEILTIVRHGLKEDRSEAYEILDNFYWEVVDMEAVMEDMSNDIEPEEAARQWVDDNQDKVSKWVDGIEEVDGESIELAYTPWDSEIASANVIKIVLEDMGYVATITQVELGPMFHGVASGSIDATIAPWLPTHIEYYEDLKDEFEDLGPNLEEAFSGLVVPSYMDIDSIEDLVK